MEALNQFHEKCGMGHCDLKLDNVMFDKDGNAKLVDFGHAREDPEPDDFICPSPTPEEIYGEKMRTELL